MITLALAFFVTALLYASVGFGGGSTYIALLVLVGITPTLVPVIAPACNILVVIGGTLRFARARLIPWRRVLPLVAASAPLAYLGGLTPISQKAFIVLLGVSLLVAGFLLVFFTGRAHAMVHRTTTAVDIGLGAMVGYLAGLVGIGGGIFLSPIQHLMLWARAKQIAATASIFILVNSLAGLAGQLTKLGLGGVGALATFWPLFVAVVVGGQLGSYVSIRRFNEAAVRRATGLLILYVALQLLWRTLVG